MSSQGDSAGVAGGFYPGVLRKEWDGQRTSRPKTLRLAAFASCSGSEFQLLKLLASVSFATGSLSLSWPAESKKT